MGKISDKTRYPVKNNPVADDFVIGTDSADDSSVSYRIGDIVGNGTGIIQNWEKGKIAEIHYKCCDDGEYWLIADDGFELKYPAYYVPEILNLTGEGFGDYVIMTIDENGKIKNWNNNPDISDFLETDDN